MSFSLSLSLSLPLMFAMRCVWAEGEWVVELDRFPSLWFPRDQLMMMMMMLLLMEQTSAADLHQVGTHYRENTVW